MKTKAETDNEILERASKDNNEISEIRVRHSESQHPIDCSCSLCLDLRFKGVIDENPKIEELDWNVE